MNIIDHTDLSDAEIIALQAKLLIEAQYREQEYKARFNSIHSILYSIGAPLNDNKLKYTKEQLKPFFDISNYTE